MSRFHDRPDRTPSDGLIWQPRPFPDTNLLLLTGRRPALVDSGFVGHAEQTAAWARAHTGALALVVNTHWHADHVGGNALLQAAGADIAASALDAAAVARRDPGCCIAEYLDQPVAPYTVDQALDDGQLLRLGDAVWQVVATPGHTPGHLSLWQPDERLLVVGDALSDYDVGWVNIALDGPDTATTALASVQRLAELEPAGAATRARAVPPTRRRARRRAASRTAPRRRPRRRGLVRRTPHLRLRPHDPRRHPRRRHRALPAARAWLTDAALLLRVTPEDLAAALVDTMRRSGAVTIRQVAFMRPRTTHALPLKTSRSPSPAPGEDPSHG